MSSDTERAAAAEGRPADDAVASDELGGAPPFTIAGRRDGPRAVVEVGGELDLQSVETVKSTVGAVLADGVRTVDIDASRLRFIDSVGLTALLHVRAAAIQAGIGFRVTAASEQLVRLVAIAGADDLLLPGDASV